MQVKLAIWTLVVVVAPSTLEAQSITLKLGRSSPRIESDLWTENLETFTAGRGDFDAFYGGVELGLPLSRYFEIAVGVDASTATSRSFYRDLVRDDGTEIVHDTTLRSTPVTAGVRAFPFGSGRGVRPYASGGAAIQIFEYREEGEFVDFESFDIFSERFVERGAAPGVFLGAGVEIAVRERWLLVAEYRREWARGTHGGDFDGFGAFRQTTDRVSFGVKLHL